MTLRAHIPVASIQPEVSDLLSRGLSFLGLGARFGFSRVSCVGTLCAWTQAMKWNQRHKMGVPTAQTGHAGPAQQSSAFTVTRTIIVLVVAVIIEEPSIY